MISVGEHNYSENAGTSMAAPHISAIAALAKSVNPDATPDRILSAMQKSAQNRPIQNCDQYSCGPGIVDAGKTLEYLDNPVKNPDPWNNGPIFYDIHKNMPFYQEIQWIGAQGITTGYPDGTFRPADNVERGAMAAFFYRYAGQPEYVMPSTSPFRDVSVGSSFYREITWLHSTGIANGWQDGTYRPVDPIRRDAMAAFIYRYAHKK
jgi:peptidase, subtilisin family